MSFELPGLSTSSTDVLSTTSLPAVFAQDTLTTSLTGLGGASQSLLFVDGSVTDYQQLVAGVTPGTEIHVLNPVQDAVTQITNTLLGRQNISSLHIVSHGEAGRLDFGSSQLNFGDLPGYASQLQSWGNALTNDADILLYGCNVAQGELGKAFTSILSQLTGADVAASNDITGNASLSGNWTLEYQTGSIEAELAFQAGTLNQYSHRLLAGDLDTTFGTGGKVITPIGSSDDFGYSVAIDSSGNIVVAGSAYNGSNDDFALARYTSTGILDTTFGTGGKVITPIGSSNDFGSSVAIDSNDKIVVAGSAYNGSNYDFALARYDNISLPTNLLWRNSGTGENAVWQLNNFTLENHYFLPTVADPNWQIASTADFNDDGIADILWRNKATGENVIWQMNSTGFETDHFITQVPDANWEIVSTNDFNGDGIADILWRNKASGENAIWQMKNDFTLQSGHFITQVPDANWQIVSTNDFNGDGIADILWRNQATGENAIWQMKNDFTLQSGHFITQVPDANWQIVNSNDFNGDGIADICLYITVGI